MKRIAFALALATATAYTAVPAVAGQEPSDALAAHTLRTLDGESLWLSSLRGEVVVVNFWASWCPPCRKELPVMDAWNAEWSGRGARVVAVSIDREARNARRFTDGEDFSLTLVHDGPDGLARKLDLPSLPCTYVLDRDGRVVSVIRSSSDTDLASIRRDVEAMLSATSRTATEVER